MYRYSLAGFNQEDLNSNRKFLVFVCSWEFLVLRMSGKSRSYRNFGYFVCWSREWIKALLALVVFCGVVWPQSRLGVKVWSCCSDCWGQPGYFCRQSIGICSGVSCGNSWVQVGRAQLWLLPVQHCSCYQVAEMVWTSPNQLLRGLGKNVDESTIHTGTICFQIYKRLPPLRFKLLLFWGGWEFV